MEYSKKFIREVIRLKSPVAAFYRAVTDDFKLDGYTVPKGAAFMYHLSAVQCALLTVSFSTAADRYLPLHSVMHVTRQRKLSQRDTMTLAAH
eukprot:12972-Heterococcus_DN1.PRE.2